MKSTVKPKLECPNRSSETAAMLLTLCSVAIAHRPLQMEAGSQVSCMASLQKQHWPALSHPHTPFLCDSTLLIWYMSSESTFSVPSLGRTTLIIRFAVYFPPGSRVSNDSDSPTMHFYNKVSVSQLDQCLNGHGNTRSLSLSCRDYALAALRRLS